MELSNNSKSEHFQTQNQRKRPSGLNILGNQSGRLRQNSHSGFSTFNSNLVSQTHHYDEKKGAINFDDQSINENLKMDDIHEIKSPIMTPHEDMNWWEFRIKGKCPERRAYHSAFVYDRKMYVFGGKDMQSAEPGSGLIDSVWSYNCQQLVDFIPGESEYVPNPTWVEVKCSGISKPKPVSGHTSIVYGDKMALYGGLNADKENTDMYSLDLTKKQWQLMKPKPLNDDQFNMPGPRDEHSAVLWNDSMVIFGGFQYGKRMNDVCIFNFKNNKWERLRIKGQKPPPRAGHSAVIRVDDKNEINRMYIFGGKINHYQKLNDTWYLDLDTKEWHQIEHQNPPSERSGHCATVFRQYMIIQGGMRDVTKELNDMHIFDFENEQWLCLFNQIISPDGKGKYKLEYSESRNMSPIRGQDTSPLFSNRLEDQRPSTFLKLKPGEVKFDSVDHGLQRNIADRLRIKEPTHRFGLPLDFREKLAEKRKHSMGTFSNSSGFRKKSHFQNKKKGTEEGLQRVSIFDDPTSKIMKESYVIKNEDPSFAKNYQKMMKNKRISGKSLLNRGSKNTDQTRKEDGTTSNQNIQSIDPNLTKFCGKRPPARDGHTCIVIETNLFIFGGDRHHMPFNDLYLLDMLSEFEGKELIEVRL